MNSPKLTRKQKAFADELLNDKKLSATQAALRTYGKTAQPTTYRTARQIATENMAKPSIQSYLNSHDYESQAVIVKSMTQEADKRLAFDAARDIQDRLHGKATQKVEQTSTGVTLVIDLTNSLKD